MLAFTGRLLSRFEGFVIFTCYATLIALVGLETVRRMVTGNQVIWAPEIALYAFIWLSWFAMGEHIYRGTHLSFASFRKRLSIRWQTALELFDCLLWLGIGGIILFYSFDVLQVNFRMGQTVFGTPIPTAIANLAIPLGWAFSMLRVIQRMVVLIKFPHRLSDANQPIGEQ